MDALRTGRVVQVIAGFYHVAVGPGETVMCRARGRLKGAASIYPGDLVRVLLFEDEPGTGRVEEVLPRASLLQRPAVANVTRVLVVMALAQPRPQSFLLDRLLVLTHLAGLEPLIVWNKADLEAEPESLALIDIYRVPGYPSVVVSAATGRGMEALVASLGDGVGVLAGPSGAGKSSILNRLVPEAAQETSTVSRKSGRGRHTTRSVRLCRVGDGWLADTPGFSRLDLPLIEPRELPTTYPEFAEPARNCRYDGCLHASEPGCAVRDEVERGTIPPLRYEQYRRLLDEVIEAYRNRYR